jgi:hypothetical protein
MLRGRFLAGRNFVAEKLRKDAMLSVEEVPSEQTQLTLGQSAGAI